MSANAARTMGMGGHQRLVGGSDEWYTPPSVFAALNLDFDLDPCAPPGGVPWVPALRSMSIEDDGLSRPWLGRVWLNPPYGAQTAHWMRRLADHGNGVALVFARTDTSWFHEAAPTCDAICLVAGRLTFIDGSSAARGPHNSGAPSMLMAWGGDNAHALRRSALGLHIANAAPRLSANGMQMGAIFDDNLTTDESSTWTRCPQDAPISTGRTPDGN